MDLYTANVCEKCAKNQRKNKQLRAVRRVNESVGKKKRTIKWSIKPERGLWKWTKLYKMRVLCDFGEKNDELTKDAKTAQNTTIL